MQIAAKKRSLNLKIQLIIRAKLRKKWSLHQVRLGVITCKSEMTWLSAGSNRWNGMRNESPSVNAITNSLFTSNCGI